MQWLHSRVAVPLVIVVTRSAVATDEEPSGVVIDNVGDVVTTQSSSRAHREYTERSLTAEEVAAVVPLEPIFSTVSELQRGCNSAIVFEGPSDGSGQTEVNAPLEEFRLHVLGFYGSGYPVMSPDPVVNIILEKRKEVSVYCPLVVMQVLYLRIEELLVHIYQGNAQQRNQHLEKFSEAAQLHAQVNALERWVHQLLPEMFREDADAPLGWPLGKARSRVARYYAILWDDVHDSTETWAVMERPGEISDELYHSALAEVSQVLGSFADVQWWPCRGTLIALMRHGARAGTLSRGLVDVVERDIDVMLGIQDEDAWAVTSRQIEEGLKKLGWDRCWTKTSVGLESHLRDVARRDLLYCVRMSPAYVLLDVTSYITGADDPHVFVHRVCGSEGAAASGLGAIVAIDRLRREGAEAEGQFGDNCSVPRNVGPLQHGGGLLRKDAIYPLARCRATASLEVPCPRQPLNTIKAMVHSGLDAGCIALPDAKGRDPEDEASARLTAVGLCAEDVGILRERSAWLQSMGFQSMSSLFADCHHLAEVVATPCL